MAFKRLLDQATDEGLLEPDLNINLQIVDAIRANEISGKEAMKLIKKKLVHKNPNVILMTLSVLEMAVKNCGSIIQSQIATHDFMKEYKKLIETAPRNVKMRALDMIQTWAHAFKDQATYQAVPDNYNMLRMEGYEFPPFNAGSEAMFKADVAPEWADATSCHRCRTKFTLTTRKHHCRNCGQVFCNKCSSQSIAIPKLGIEKPVRVCDHCLEELGGTPVPGGTSQDTSGGNSDLAELQKRAMANQDLTPEEEVRLALERDRSLASASAPAPVSSSGTDKQKELELKEKEELELALALSMSEAESQPARSSRPTTQRQNYYQEASAPEPSPLPASRQGSGSVYDSALNSMQEHEDKDNMELYLSRSQQRQESSRQSSRSNTDQQRRRQKQAQKQSQQRQQSQAQSQAQAQPVLFVPPVVQENLKSNSTEGEIDYSVANPLANSKDQDMIRSISSGLALFELKLNRAATRGRGIEGNVEIQSLQRSLALMQPELLARAEELGVEKDKYETMKDKYNETKEARERYNDRCELHRHKVMEQQREQELLEKLQLEQRLKLIEQQERDRLAQQRASEEAMKAELMRRQAERDYQIQLGHQRLQQLQMGQGGQPVGMQMNNPQMSNPQMSSPAGGPAYTGVQPASDVQRLQALNQVAIHELQQPGPGSYPNSMSSNQPIPSAQRQGQPSFQGPSSNFQAQGFRPGSFPEQNQVGSPNMGMQHLPQQQTQNFNPQQQQQQQMPTSQVQHGFHAQSYGGFSQQQQAPMSQTQPVPAAPPPDKPLISFD
eukprot:m.335262 g.335262  ORF g.335262 m.335262 type:complete len:780 (-) comp17556_c0_seq1:44-2383(-)